MVTLVDGDLEFVVIASALAILPTTVLMGVAFPFGVRLYVGDDPDPGRRIGTFYGLNVAAGIAGSLVAGFILVPVLGTRRSLIVLVLASVAAAAVVAITAWDARRQRTVIAVVAVVLAALVLGPAVPNPYSSALRYRYPDERLLWIEEGAQTTVSIQERSDGTRAMYLDGLHQANDAAFMVGYHRLIGTLAVALHPDPRSALVVGLGGGVTAYGVSSIPTVDVEVVELSDEVVRGAVYLERANQRVVDRANVDIRVDDGRNHLLVTEKRYDVITADVIQPVHAGAGKVWSIEYWELARDALADGGLMLQWVPDERDVHYEMIVRSFLEVFPNATAWANGSMLVGTREPLRIDADAFDARLADPATRAALESVGIVDATSLAGLYTAGPDELRAFVGPGPVLDDDHPRVEYFRTLGTGAAAAPRSRPAARRPRRCLRLSRGQAALRLRCDAFLAGQQLADGGDERAPEEPVTERLRELRRTEDADLVVGDRLGERGDPGEDAHHRDRVGGDDEIDVEPRMLHAHRRFAMVEHQPQRRRRRSPV